mgnify:FL=1
MPLLEELRRRHIGRAAALYVAVAWAGTEILAFLFEEIPVFPAWADTVIAVLFVLGFPVTMFLAWVFDVGPGGVKRTDPGSATGRVTIALSLGLLATGTAGLSLLLIPRLPAESGEAAESVIPEEAPRNSVAVLPFVNIGAGEETEFFADGVAEEILNGLAQVQALQVAARTSTFSFKDRNVDVREIADALGVRHIVEGSVRRFGDRLRVNARLVNAGDGYQLWSRTFEGTVSDIFAFQDDIAQGVATALGEELNEPNLGSQARTTVQTSNVQAYDRYLLARQIWRQRQEGPIRRSIELLEEALELDPQFASAWAALASANLTLPVYASDAPGAHDRAEEAAYQALSLDPEKAEAHAVLGSLEVGRGAWMAAEARYERARELAPNNPTVRLWYSELLAKTGHLERAVGEIEVALEVDPLYAPAIGNAGHQYASLGRLDEADAMFRRSWDLGLHAMFVWFGSFYVDLMRDRFDEAEAWLDARPVPYGIEADQALLAALRTPSEAKRARGVEAVLAARERGMALREVALYLGALEAVDPAFDLLLPAVGRGWTSTESLWSLWTAPLRRDPRFTELVRALDLVDFWQVRGPPSGCKLEAGAVRCGPPAEPPLLTPE